MSQSNYSDPEPSTSAASKEEEEEEEDGCTICFEVITVVISQLP